MKSTVIEPRVRVTQIANINVFRVYSLPTIEEFDSGLYKARTSVEVGSSKQAAVSKIAQGQKLIGTSDCSGKQ